MAESRSRMQSRGGKPGAGALLKLRTMRVEAIYRRDTRYLERAERDRYSNFLWNVVRLDMGPKVRLSDLVGETGNQALAEQEDDLSESLDFYSRKDPGELLQVLRFFSVYVMQQARQAKNQRQQLFLVFKAVDLLRIIVQHSPHAVDYHAESMVTGIFADLATQLPQRFRPYYDAELRILALVRRLFHAPNDHAARAQLADAYASQTSLYDAFVQYQMLLKVLPAMRLELDRRRGLIHVRRGHLFQGLANMNLTALQDARKLRNFVERYNRDHPEPGAQIPALSGPDPQGLRRIQRAFRSLANRAYLLAVKVLALEPHVLLDVYTKLGGNLLAESRFKEAATALIEGNRYYKPELVTAKVLEQRLSYLDLLANATQHAGRREMHTSVQAQISDVTKRHRALLAASAEKQKRREALLSAEDEI